MGNGRMSANDWLNHATSTASKPRAAIFRGTGMHADLDPRTITLRESCDGPLNPNSTPIIIAIDETGSMGYLAEVLIKKALGPLVQEIYDRKPVTDPHVMCMAFGDAWADHIAPLQVTQFEADMKLVEQIENFYLEGNGGGNGYESYNLPWWFAATKTKCDAMLKRGKKGYLFTMGDEGVPPVLKAEHVKQWVGGGLEQDISTEDLLAMVSQQWEVFHLMVEEGFYFQRAGDTVTRQWRELLGERALRLSDHTKMAEVIVSTLQVIEGADADTVSSSWSGDTSLVVRNAVGGLNKKNNSGVVRL